MEDRLKKVNDVYTLKMKKQKMAEMLAIELDGFVKDDYPYSITTPTDGYATSIIDPNVTIRLSRPSGMIMFTLNFRKNLSKDQMKKFLNFYKDF